MRIHLAHTRVALLQLCRIADREQGVAAEPAAREPKVIRITEEERVLGALGTEVLAELVAEVGGGVALREDRRRRG